MASFSRTDIPARFENAFRMAGGNNKTWICPECSARFQGSVNLWIHAKDRHKGIPEVQRKDEAARKEFLHKARQLQQQAEGQQAEKREPQNKDDTRGSGVGDEQITHRGEHQASPSPPPENISSDGADALRSGNVASSSNVPQKRRVETDFVAPVQIREGRTGPVDSPRGLHGHSPLGGLPEKYDTMNDRQAISTERDPDFVRNTGSRQKALFNSEVDSPSGRANRNQGLGKHKKRHSSTRQPNTEWDRPRTHPHTNISSITNINLEEKKKHPPDDLLSVDDTQITYIEGDNPKMLLQPETRPISHDQLVVEVKGIYAGLVLVEAKCIDVDEKQAGYALEKDPSKRPKLEDHQWQSLIALHKQLLHEHHDFFLASQHPSADRALKKLAARYAMPARMWRHGIHAFLEVLRHRLPGSKEHMLAFIYIAYSMMALLYETVSAFEDTWIECLGDLGRYRMAIEEDEPKDREVWSNVARFWYNKASDKSPSIGRLYHHLAILARPYSWEQLSLYARSLTCETPFESARGSIMTLFNPILQNRDHPGRRPSSVETIFIHGSALFFTSQVADSTLKLESIITELERGSAFASYIEKTGPKFKENGVFIAISSLAILFDYGLPKLGSRLRFIYDKAWVKSESEKKTTADETDTTNQEAAPKAEGDEMQLDNIDVSASLPWINQGSRLAFLVLNLVLTRPKDKNGYPLVHVYLVFLLSLLQAQQQWKPFEDEPYWTIIVKNINWVALCDFLNVLMGQLRGVTTTLYNDEFPSTIKDKGDKESSCPLPDDLMLRGQVYSRWYFPEDHFKDFVIDDDVRTLELPSMTHPRTERCVWLGNRIAKYNIWMWYDYADKMEPFKPTGSVLNLHNTSIPSSECSSRTQSWDTNASSDSKTSIESHTTTASESTLTDSETVTSDCAPTVTHARSTSSAGPTTPTAMDTSDEPIVPDRYIDDTPMADISPGKAPSTTVTWPQDNVVDSGTSPPPLDIGKPGVEIFASDPEKLKSLYEHEDENVDEMGLS